MGIIGNAPQLWGQKHRISLHTRPRHDRSPRSYHSGEAH
jgi:hypothetical protein